MGSAPNGQSKEKTDTVGTCRKIDQYGFKRDEDFDYKSYENFESEYLAVLVRRRKRWDQNFFGGNQHKNVKHRRMVKRFCRKGVPDAYRGLVWMDVSGATKLMQKEPNKYNMLLESQSEKDRLLQEAINTDLYRTFPDNVYFKQEAQENHNQKLNNVLLAYGRHQPKVGYCQGMNYIAALLLLVVKDEEKCFWLLCALIDKILPQYYSGKMEALRAELKVLTTIVRNKYPIIQQIMDSENVPWMLISSKWFICLFIDILPVETVLRIWDCLFYEGSKVLFRVALFLIKDKEEALKGSSGMPDIMESFKNLKHDDRALECHQFMKDCFTETNPLSRAEITKLRLEFVAKIEESDQKLDAKRSGK